LLTSTSVASKVVNRVEQAKHSRRRQMLSLSFAGLESITLLLVFLHFGHCMIKSFQLHNGGGNPLGLPLP